MGKNLRMEYGFVDMFAVKPVSEKTPNSKPGSTLWRERIGVEEIMDTQAFNN
jgi:hypothetical protein